MTPAEVVIKELGVRPLARELNVYPSCITRWRTRGGNVPDEHKKKILEIAGGKITAEEMIYGRPDAN